MGYIYILTNPLYDGLVKIGYAENIKNRLAALNASSGLPFSFKVFATYQVENSRVDVYFHKLIDFLNPSLRTVEENNGVERKREFFKLSPEDAYYLLEMIALMTNTKDKLKKGMPETLATKTSNKKDTVIKEKILPTVVMPKVDRKNNSDMNNIEMNIGVNFDEKIEISKEAFFGDKNLDMVEIYKYLENKIITNTSGIEINVYNTSIEWAIKGNIFATFLFIKNKICIRSLPPKNSYKDEENSFLPHIHTHSYCFYISSIKELEVSEAILRESYNQRVYYNSLKNGLYFFNYTYCDTKENVSGCLEIIDGKFILKAGSDIAKNNRRQKEFKKYFNKLKTENWKLVEDFTISSPYFATLFIVGEALEDFIKWKNDAGNYIDIYREKEDN